MNPQPNKCLQYFIKKASRNIFYSTEVGEVGGGGEGGEERCSSVIAYTTFNFLFSIFVTVIKYLCVSCCNFAIGIQYTAFSFPNVNMLKNIFLRPILQSWSRFPKCFSFFTFQLSSVHCTIKKCVHTG